MSNNYKVIIFDLDGTLITGIQYIYSHLWDYFGVSAEARKKPVIDFMNHRITYEEWVAEDVRLLNEAGATKGSLIEVFGELKLIDNALETIQTIKAAEKKLVIISGSIELALKTVIPNYEELFDDVFINRYFFDAAGAITHARATPYDMEHKATGVIDMAKKHGCTLDEIAFIGDSDNDIHAAAVAGFSIAFNCKSERLREVSDIVIKSDCVKEVLKHIL